jgi:hypothetical protein
MLEELKVFIIVEMMDFITLNTSINSVQAFEPVNSYKSFKKRMLNEPRFHPNPEIFKSPRGILAARWDF